MATYAGGTATYGGRSAGHGGVSMVEGILLVLVGLAAIVAPLFFNFIMSLVLPSVLAVAGVAHIISGVRDRTFGGAVLAVLLGLVAIAAAVVLFARPVLRLATIQAIMITFFFGYGVLQLISAFAAPRGSGRGFVGFSGVVNIAVAALLLFGAFGRSLVLIGIYLGVSILLTGIALLVQGASARPTRAGGAGAY